MSQISNLRDRLRIRHLRLLEMIDDHSSLRAISEQLNLTQPAVSSMLKDLEAAFGVTLVERSARGVALNEAGKTALQRTRAALSIVENLAGEILVKASPVLRVGANPALFERFLPLALAQVTRQTTGVHFKLRAGTVGLMMEQLIDGDLDCYIGRVDKTVGDPLLADALRITPLGQSDLVIVCNPDHPLAKRHDVTAQDLSAADWALQVSNSKLRPTVESIFRINGLSPPVPLFELAGGPHEMMRFAQRLNVLVCVPKVAVWEEIARGEIHVVDVPTIKMAPIQICFVNLKENEALPALQHLRNAMQEVFLSDPSGLSVTKPARP